MKVDLLEKALKDVDHDACPVIGMVIRLETSLCEKVAISRQKVTLVLDTTGNKAKPLLACLLISTTPSI